MSDETRPAEEPQAPQEQDDVEGHSLLYEQARTFARDRERDAQRQARDARLLEERKDQKPR